MSNKVFHRCEKCGGPFQFSAFSEDFASVYEGTCSCGHFNSDRIGADDGKSAWERHARRFPVIIPATSLEEPSPRKGA